MKIHPDVLAAHDQFGGDLESMQRLYDSYDLSAEITTLRKELVEARSENETLARVVEFCQRWSWREDPPNSNARLSVEERLNAIKYHPSIKPSKAKGEKK